MDEINLKTNNAILALMIEEEELNSLRGDMGVVKNGDDLETHAGKLFVKDDIITLRENATLGLGAGFAGFVAKKYDGAHDGQLVFGSDGYARVGDVGYLQIIATRDKDAQDKGIAYFDDDTKQFKTKLESDLNAGKIGGISSGSLVRKDTLLNSSFYENNLIFSHAGSSNIDHIWNDDSNNTFHFISDSTYKGSVVHSIINAGKYKENGVLLTDKYLGINAKASDSDKLDGFHASAFPRKDYSEQITGFWDFKKQVCFSQDFLMDSGQGLELQGADIVIGANSNDSIGIDKNMIHKFGNNDFILSAESVLTLKSQLGNTVLNIYDDCIIDLNALSIELNGETYVSGDISARGGSFSNSPKMGTVENTQNDYYSYPYTGFAHFNGDRDGFAIKHHHESDDAYTYKVLTIGSSGQVKSACARKINGVPTNSTTYAERTLFDNRSTLFPISDSVYNIGSSSRRYKNGYFENLYSKIKDTESSLDLEVAMEPGTLWIRNKSNEVYHRNMVRCMRGSYTAGGSVVDNAWIFSNEIGVNDGNGWRDWVTPTVKAVGETKDNKWTYSINAGGYNGSPVLTVTNRSGSKRVGVLNDNPSEALDVNGNIKVGNTTENTDRKVIVNSGDLNKSGFEAYGSNQGTGYLYIGQSSSHGGGISYNGDNNPAHVSGETTDHITFYRRTNNTNHAVFQYAHGSNKVYFKDSIDVVNSVQASYFYADGDKGFTCAPSNGRGLRFWDSDSYKIYMSHSGDEKWGGRVSPTDESNMYFRMNGASTRGFVFAGSNGAVTHITGDGSIYSKKFIEGSVPFVGGFTGIGTTRLDLASSRLTVDNLTVRQTMNVYELIVNQVRGTNGSLAITNTAKIDTVFADGGLNYTCTIDQGKDNKLYQPFRSGDFVYSQTFTGKSVKYWVGKVIAITDNSFSIEIQDGIVVFNDPTDHGLPTNTDYNGGVKYDISGISGNVTLQIEGYDFEGGARVSMRTNGSQESLIGTMSAGDGATTTFSFDVELQGDTEISIYSTNADAGTIRNVKILSRNSADIPEVGDVVHQRGNSIDSNRQGFMYLTSSDQGAPYFDVSDGINSATPQHNTRIRLGKLSGISGNNGYGIWASSDGLNEGFAISSDGYARIAGWNFNDNAIYKNFYGNVEVALGQTPSINTSIRGLHICTDSTNRMFIGVNGSDDMELKSIHDGNEQFALVTKADGTTANHIAGWNFNHDTLYKVATDIKIAAGKITGSSVQGFHVQKGTSSASNRVSTGYSGSNWGIWGTKDGNNIFQLGSTNQIAGWNFNEKYLYKDKLYIGSSGLRSVNAANRLLIGHYDTANPHVKVIGNNTSDFAQLFWNSTSDWGIIGSKGGTRVFELGATNQIAGWSFNNDTLHKQINSTYLSIGKSHYWSSGWNGIHVGRNEQNRIWLGSNGTSEELTGYQNGTRVFQLGGLGNNIAGWGFDSSRIWKDAGSIRLAAGASRWFSGWYGFEVGRDADNRLSILGNSSTNAYQFRCEMNNKEYFHLGSDGQRIAGWTFNDTTLSKTLGSKGLIKIGNLPISGQYGFSVGTNDNNHDQDIIKMFMTDGNAGYFQGRKDGITIFDLRTDGVSSIAGWNFDSTALWTGTKQSSNEFTTNGLTIHKDGAIRAKNFRIDTNGSAFFNGTIESQEGKIANWIINPNYIAHDSTFNGGRHTIALGSTIGAMGARGGLGFSFYRDDSAVDSGLVKTIQIGQVSNKDSVTDYSNNHYGINFGIKGGKSIFRIANDGATIAGFSFTDTQIKSSNGSIALNSNGSFSFANGKILGSSDGSLTLDGGLLSNKIASTNYQSDGSAGTFVDLDSGDIIVGGNDGIKIYGEDGKIEFLADEEQKKITISKESIKSPNSIGGTSYNQKNISTIFSRQVAYNTSLPVSDSRYINNGSASSTFSTSTYNYSLTPNASYTLSFGGRLRFLYEQPYDFMSSDGGPTYTDARVKVEILNTSNQVLFTNSVNVSSTLEGSTFAQYVPFSMSIPFSTTLTSIRIRVTMYVDDFEYELYYIDEYDDFSTFFDGSVNVRMEKCSVSLISSTQIVDLSTKGFSVVSKDDVYFQLINNSTPSFTSPNIKGSGFAEFKGLTSLGGLVLTPYYVGESSTTSGYKSVDCSKYSFINCYPSSSDIRLGFSNPQDGQIIVVVNRNDANGACVMFPNISNHYLNGGECCIIAYSKGSTNPSRNNGQWFIISMYNNGW